MEIGRCYNAYEVVRELEPFLNELRLSGYRVQDFREGAWRYAALLVVFLGDQAIGVYLNPSGNHSVAYINDMWGRHESFASTEEVESLVASKIKRCEACKEIYHGLR